MKKIILFFSIFLICFCKGQTKINTIKAFEEELTKFTLEKFRNNCPYKISNAILAESSYYASFKAIGNSSTKLMFDLNNDNQKSLEFKINKYTMLENSKLKIEDYNVYYPYKEKLLLLSDVSNEWIDVIGEVDLRNDEVEIYLIEEGNLDNTFKQEGKVEKPHNYSCGIYIFKKSKKLIYWFVISK
ncbi:hypothetical protein [Flavobacterium capsici]|uniref:Uncharacterized protein n=1 Tax=Flavobacterium capsici TaxID=3075618 RepID=A0AA96J783_9FLAO|nr:MULTISPECIES: hypothetical protein [unclassified Flavobacterium]WNM18014.1 hypothetical protein RN608_08305 [Flavobacterium sp. PMR2A8]WNM22066.1 hypothetical protein RN605_01605 [Flavobacterium sp. PMTSA4]